SSLVQIESQSLQQQLQIGQQSPTNIQYNYQQRVQLQRNQQQPPQRQRSSSQSRPQLSYYTPPNTTNMNSLQPQQLYGMMPTNQNPHIGVNLSSPTRFSQHYID